MNLRSHDLDVKRLFAAICLAGVLSACGSATGSVQSPTPTPMPTASPSASPSTPSSPSPSPTVSPSPVAPTPPAGFVDTSVGGGAVAVSTVTTARVGAHDGYDRFVIEFGGGIPAFTVTPQSTSTFTRSPQGQLVTLDGTTGVKIVIHSVSNWTAYAGPTEFRPGYAYLREAVQVENFEGYQQWALGVQGKVYVRVGTLESPARLVVDVVGI